jgi:hypothetical protein
VTLMPPLVGLCPGEHLGEFYMPLAPGDSTICSGCDRELVLFGQRDYLLAQWADRRKDALEKIIEGLRLYVDEHGGAEFGPRRHRAHRPPRAQPRRVGARQRCSKAVGSPTSPRALGRPELVQRWTMLFAPACWAAPSARERRHRAWHEDYCDICGAVFHEHIATPPDSWLAGIPIETCPQIPSGWVYIDGVLFTLVEGERSPRTPWQPRARRSSSR